MCEYDRPLRGGRDKTADLRQLVHRRRAARRDIFRDRNRVALAADLQHGCAGLAVVARHLRHAGHDRVLVDGPGALMGETVDSPAHDGIAVELPS